MPRLLSILLLLFFLFLSGNLRSQPQDREYSFHHLTTRQGLPSNIVNSIIKDSTGFMWFGTGNGLARYDGYNFKIYQLPFDSVTGSANQTIVELFEYDKKFILIGTSHHGLLIFNKVNESFKFYTNNPKEINAVNHNWVNSIIRDKDGIVWIGTQSGLDRLDLTNGSIKTIRQEPNKPESLKDHLRAVFEDSQGILWLGTADGVYHFNRTTEEFTKFDLRSEIPEGYFRKVTCFVEDKDGVIWIGSMWGLYGFDPLNDELVAYEPWHHSFGEKGTDENEFMLSNIHVESLQISDVDGEYSLWVATQWGLNKFNIETGVFTKYFHEKDNPASISGNFSLSLHLDESGLLWIGLISGLDVVNIKTNPFHQVKIPYPDAASNYFFQVSSFIVDENDTLWIAGINEGIIQYDPDFNYVGNYARWNYIGDSIGEHQQNMIGHIFLDSQKRMWAGYFGWGLTLFDRKSRSFTKIDNHPDNTAPAPHIVNFIAEDYTGILWAGSSDGLFYLYLKEDNPFLLLKVTNSIVGSSEVLCIYEDRFKNLFVSTLENGLYLLAKSGREIMQFKNVPFRNEPSEPVLCTQVNSLYEDGQGTLWLGADNGLFRYEHSSSSIVSDSIFNKDYGGFLLSVLGDKEDNLWIYHINKGLIRYNPYSNQRNAIKQFNTRTGLPFADFNTNMANATIFYQSDDGRLFIGSAIGSGDGFMWFQPDEVMDNKKMPMMVITEFRVGNKAFDLDSAVSWKRKIVLEYNQNFFSFEFAALDFLIPEKNQYAYFLEGYDLDWNYSGNMRFANYTGVPPGVYIFRVKGSNNDGYWNETGISIHLTILPPFWRTWWAYLIYFMVFVAIIYSIIHYYLRRQKLLHRLEIEHLETENLKELDGLKTRFFTNISHEFRTPLTLILGPGKQLISKLSDPANKHTLSIILKNANRLRVLINQLLSLSKLDSGKMQLHTAETNIIPLVRGYVQSFESLAKQHKIELIFKALEDNINTWIDFEKLEQILYNLLSNAFKFTKSGDSIEVKVETQKNTSGILKDVQVCSISVSDSGSGIPKEKLANIFDRFYQADDSLIRSTEGTGIGLAVVKELVSLHHGDIKVESEYGHGTNFTIFFPLGKKHLNPDEILDETFIDPFESTTTAFKEVNLTEQPAKKGQPIGVENELPLMLIVEDNSDMRTYISSFFDTEFQIIESENGKEGIDIAFENIPDIIISDIMMPEMDGNEFCKTIKKDERTSHIPIILLTAKASKESRIESLETGADDFITKPFDGDELKVRVNNLVEQRNKLRKLIENKLRQRKNTFDINLDDSNISSMDEKFLRNLISILGNQYTNSGLKVEDFTREVGLSRIQLHRKITALTGTTTSEFIRNFRLNRAADLIKQKSGSISEIAYDVGFNSPSYFTESFKKYFGVPPSDYNE